MGLLDWIYRQWKRTPPPDDADDAAADLADGADAFPSLPPLLGPDPLLDDPAPVPPPPPPRPKKAKKVRTKAAKPPRPPKPPPDPDRPRKKKRKFSPEPPPQPLPSVPIPTPTPLPPPPPPPPQVDEPAPQVQVQEPVRPRPVVVEDRAQREERLAAKKLEREREDETWAWVVLPKLEALLSGASELLSAEGVDREGLVRGRKHLEQEWRRLLPLPESQASRLDAAYAERHGALSARIAALPDPRDEEEQRHLAVREGLVAEAEALASAPDVRAALERSRVLQGLWKESLRQRVPRAAGEGLYGRWRAAQDALYARRDTERSERLQRLEALVQQAELLGKGRDAERAAEAMKGLQQRWKAVGGVRGEEADALWGRFRAAADDIFERRRVAVAEQQLQSQRAREALIAHAEEQVAAGGAVDPEEVVRQLHLRWRRLGPAPREQADALWAAFRASCERLLHPPEREGEGAPRQEAEPLRFSPFAALQEPEREE